MHFFWSFGAVWGIMAWLYICFIIIPRERGK